MKHITTIIFLLLAGINSAFAIHSFVNESKLWHCKKWKQAFTGLEDRYYYFQGDTVINGITAKKMYLKFSKESDKGNYQAALYEEGQKVYCCYPNQKDFGLLYDFGAKKGEEVSVSSYTYLVENVEEIKVKDESLRVLHLSKAEGEETIQFTWVEGVGGESAPCHSGPNLTGGYESFSDCEFDGKVFLEAEDIPDHITHIKNDEEESALLPLFEEGKIWECIGVNQSIPPQYGHSYPKRTYTVQGDTLIEEVYYKKLHVRTVFENGDIEEDIYPVQGNTPNAYGFDFTLNKEDFLPMYESGNTQMGYQVVGTKDTILNDGIKRRCLMLEYISSRTKEDGTVKKNVLDEDIWVEGIGSLKSGLIMNDPTISGGTRYTLQGVIIGNLSVYQRKTEDKKPATLVINDAYITPEAPSIDDEVRFNVLLGTFPGNVSYYQKVDSIVGHTVYVSSSFYGYSTTTMLPVVHDSSLGHLEEGEYTLIHTVKTMPTDIKETFTYKFEVKGANQMEPTISDSHLKNMGSTLVCNSPNATTLEIYTMDAVKVSEARFTNGEATVTVGKTPATYLYIVTYPDGRRESGKVMMK